MMTHNAEIAALIEQVRDVRDVFDADLLNPRTDYARGFRDGATKALDDVLDMLDERPVTERDELRAAVEAAWDLVLTYRGRREPFGNDLRGDLVRILPPTPPVEQPETSA